MIKLGFTNYAINVSDGDVVGKLSNLARNTGIDALVMGTSTVTPLAMGEGLNPGPLGSIAADTAN
jgi:hypothetical protein